MLPADWLEYVRDAERNIKKTPAPTKRRMPRVTRMIRPEQARALSQQANGIKAIYQPESVYNRTPTRPKGFVGTREVGPGDVNNSNVDWRTGKATVSVDGDKELRK